MGGQAGSPGRPGFSSSSRPSTALPAPGAALGAQAASGEPSGGASPFLPHLGGPDPGARWPPRVGVCPAGPSGPPSGVRGLATLACPVSAPHSREARGGDGGSPVPCGAPPRCSPQSGPTWSSVCFASPSSSFRRHGLILHCEGVGVIIISIYLF